MNITYPNVTVFPISNLYPDSKCGRCQGDDDCYPNKCQWRGKAKDCSHCQPSADAGCCVAPPADNRKAGATGRPIITTMPLSAMLAKPPPPSGSWGWPRMRLSSGSLVKRGRC